MNKPPRELDGAKVLLWAVLRKENTKTDAMRLYADGKEQTEFSGIALAQFQKNRDSGVYLFYCDQEWEVENDSLYRDLEEAKAEAERQFTGLSNRWEKG